MKEKFFKFCEKFIAGGYSIKIKKDLYLGFPKIAPIFTIAFILATYGEVSLNKTITYIGYALILVGVFGFFYYNLFPKRRPKIEDFLKK